MPALTKRKWRPRKGGIDCETCPFLPKKKKMKGALTFALMAATAVFAQAQEDNYTAVAVGYSVANVMQPKLADLLVSINGANAGLTKTFEEDGLSQGFNIFGALHSGKTRIGLSYAKVGHRYRAEGVVPVISSNAAKYKVTSRLVQVLGQIEYYPARVLGIGIDGGYAYSTLRDKHEDLFFGQSNSVVDKKGGLCAGLHLSLQIPLGKGAFLMLQPYYLRALYHNDQDNVAAIYLGQGNSAPRTTPLSAVGAHISFGIKIR